MGRSTSPKYLRPQRAVASQERDLQLFRCPDLGEAA